MPNETQMESDSSQRCLVNGQKAMRTKWNAWFKYKKAPYFEDSQTVEQVVWEGSGVYFLGDAQNLAGLTATCCNWPLGWISRGPWQFQLFCDSVISRLYKEWSTAWSMLCLKLLLLFIFFNLKKEIKVNCSQEVRTELRI